MICKECGAKLDPTGKRCPACGAEYKTTGGVGFWDIAEGPKPEAAPAPAPDPAPKRSFALPIVICCLICAVCLLITVIGSLTNAERMKTMKKTLEGFEQEISDLDVTNHDAKQTLEEKLQAMEDRIGGMTAEPEPTPVPIRINSVPTEESRPVGFQSPSGHCLFWIRVEGTPDAVCWEKLLPDGEWGQIQFNEEHLCPALGLRLEGDLSEGWFKLFAAGLTPESFGCYRCRVMTGTDYQESFKLVLTEQKLEDYGWEDGAELPVYGDEDPEEAGEEIGEETGEEAVEEPGEETAEETGEFGGDRFVPEP